MSSLHRLVLFYLVAGAAVVRAEDKLVDLGTVTEKHEMVPMRDGKRLSTYLYFPAGKGLWPVVYEQRYADLRAPETRKAFARLAAAGYVVAAQNFRGTHQSEGAWVGYRALGWGEQQDGFDTVEWLAKQSWSSGKVGTFGSSQGGFAQNFLAVARPPHLVCQYMIDTGLSLFHEGYRIGGTTRPERFKQMDAVCREPADNRRLMQEWFRHPTFDAYWAEEDCSRHFEKMDVPCFTVGSWFDFMCVGSVESFIGRQHRGGLNSRGKQQLLIGPWLHGRFKETNKVGDLTYPENAKFALEAHMVRWFDHYLKGIDNGADRDPTVRYYVMGAVGEKDAPGNEWRTSPTWPLAVTATPYHLREGGKLTEQAPNEETSATTFLADPARPSEIPGRAFPGAKDARDFEKQAEVRTFTSEVLTEPVEWTGKVQAELHVSSTARDTDFIVRVSDVYPDGRSILLMDYVRRARYRDGYEKEVMMEPGKVYKVAFDIGWTSQVFNRGHRIRVTIASTGAPFYEPNPNTGEPLTIEPPEKTVVAKNTVHHDREYASRILAPLHKPGLTGEERGRLEQGVKELNERIRRLRVGKGPGPALDAVAEAEVFAVGITRALRYDTEFSPADVALLKKSLERARERVVALEDGRQPWAQKKGKAARAFVSAVDGSVQPFGVIVPAKYDRARPIRLDVVLHGSSRPVGMSELRFLARFDEGDEGGTAPDQDFVELHPLGRVENCYRWAGETDVFEAVEAVCRNYSIDRDRVVLRGMSMGASGTWHLGLKRPDRFVALGPYCGYVDTHEFSRTPLPTFVEVGPLPPHQEKALHMLDSMDYAANAGVVPAVACIGDKDVFFQSHVLMRAAMEKEGLKMVNLISPGTGHVIDPVTHREQMRRIGEIATKGLDRGPRHLRFVTWTLKYGRCHWLEVLGLEEHYARAEIEARIQEDGSVDVAEPRNVTRFAILPLALQGASPKLRVGGKPVALPAREGVMPARETVVGKRDGQWVYLGERGAIALDGKRPGLQGPIDDAFTSPFLCVRGTGKAWHAEVQAWSDASLRRFAYEWQRYFRGELPVKDDTEVTEEDVRRCNLILFGDPGSNRWIGKVLPQLPLRWTRDELQLGGERYAAANHAPVLIQPNPLAKGRYVVLNSGHTFHEKELASLNYLLFPRLGDWAVLRVSGKPPESVSLPLDETVLRAGFFDEHWK
jgi:predicted acyl esterase/pimeloyl-ACP methyl ester carboxylesterase